MSEDDARDRVRELLVELRAVLRCLPAARVVNAPDELRDLFVALPGALEVLGVPPGYDG